MSVWDEASDLALTRTDPLRGEQCILEPGVNYFVLQLERLGAEIRSSCEGHVDEEEGSESNFYVMFSAPYEIAYRIAELMTFPVTLGREQGTWVINADGFGTDLMRRDRLRKYAEIWEKGLG